MSLRYRIAKVGKVAQRITVGVVAGFVLILGSHWWADAGEREFLRDAGGTLIGISVVRWMSLQGKRRIHPNSGEQVRTPTLKIPGKKADEYRALFRQGDGKR